MPIKAIVTDIEGTTTSISFVKDELFPYAVEHVQEYLTENWTNADVQEAVKELRAQYVNDLADKIEGAVAISDGEAKEQAEQIAEVVANVKWQISIDRKTTSLKKLQGLIWTKAYNSGAIKGHVYADVPKAFERWSTDNIKIYIYSSGSVAAQKLLFANSEHGDLTSQLSGYFDTNIGMKADKNSYEKIIKEIGCEPLDVIFLTDIVKEATAAKETGMKVALLVRSGNGPLTDEEKAEYKVFTSFDDIIPSEFVTGKRKADDILTAETNAVKVAKLSDEESVIATDTNTVSATTTNGIEGTEMNMETQHVSNGNDLTTKTEIDIPIKKHDCDHKNKNDKLDVPVVEQDIIKGEKDSKPLTEVADVIKTNEPLPMEVVDDKPSEPKDAEDIEMQPIEAELDPKPKSDTIEDDGLTKIVEDTSDVDSKIVAEAVATIPDIPTENVQEEEKVAEEVSVEKVTTVETVDKNNVENRIDVSSKQNGGHTEEEVNVEKPNDKVEEAKPQTETAANEETKETNQSKEVETERLESDEKAVATASENGAKETEEIDNKENIPLEIKEKENIIEIPIHIDGDIQSAQKPSITTATNGNGIATKDDSLETAAAAAAAVVTATNSNKEKMSRIELIIEEKNNDNGQLTETTTRIVKEMILKNNSCEASETVDIMPENV